MMDQPESESTASNGNTQPLNEEEVRKQMEKFSLSLRDESESVQRLFSRLLNRRRVELVKEKGGIAHIDLAERESLLKEARKQIYVGNVDSKKMQEDWEKATSRDGRPPIGGAQDD